MLLPSNYLPRYRQRVFEGDIVTCIKQLSPTTNKAILLYFFFHLSSNCLTSFVHFRRSLVWTLFQCLIIYYRYFFTYIQASHSLYLPILLMLSFTYFGTVFNLTFLSIWSDILLKTHVLSQVLGFGSSRSRFTFVSLNIKSQQFN